MGKKGLFCLAAGLLLTGCGGSSLESDDPAGYQACQTLAESAQIIDDPAGRVGGMLEAGDLANQASTEEIHAAAEQVAGQWFANEDELRAACESNGVDIPQ